MEDLGVNGPYEGVRTIERRGYIIIIITITIT